MAAIPAAASLCSSCPAEADEKIRAEMARGVALNTLVTREQVGRGVPTFDYTDDDD